jgi:hypothetical protein
VTATVSFISSFFSFVSTVPVTTASPKRRMPRENWTKLNGSGAGSGYANSRATHETKKVSSPGAGSAAGTIRQQEHYEKSASDGSDCGVAVGCKCVKCQIWILRVEQFEHERLTRSVQAESTLWTQCLAWFWRVRRRNCEEQKEEQKEEQL